MAEETQTTPAEGKSSLWIWVVVVVAVVFGGYYLFARQATAPSVTEDANTVEEGTTNESESFEGEPVVREAQTNAEVTYEDGVFTPNSLTVKTGSQVTFKNIGTEVMWVASAPHPAHTDYPGLDQKESVGNEGSYTFTFEKIGTWKYHNHENTAAFGSITVTD